MQTYIIHKHVYCFVDALYITQINLFMLISFDAPKVH